MGEGKREESLVSIWATAQQKVLVSWLDFVQGTERLAHVAAWNETVLAWQSAVQETLDAQTRWLQDWIGRVQATSGSPTDLRKNVQQAQALLLHWTDAQQQLWQGWFRLVQQFGPILEAGPQGDERLLQTLRDSGRAIVDAQAEWVRRWAADFASR